MSDVLEKLNENIEQIALEVVMLDSDDIPAIGTLLNHVTELEVLCNETGKQVLTDLVSGIRKYLEQVALREKDDIAPVEDAVKCLQSVYHSLLNDQAVDLDMEDLFARLGQEMPAHLSSQNQGADGSVQTEEAHEEDCTENERDSYDKTDCMCANQGNESEDGPCEQETAASDEDVFSAPDAGNMDEDELAILEDFIVEAEENLNSIEIGIMDLEQSPDDIEIINSIFRPFHTIKGVSGFLNLERINKLAHSAENLLDKARGGELKVNEEIIDVILEAVDMLKTMVSDVKSGVETGGILDTGAVDINPVKKRIDDIIIRTEELGNKPIGEVLIQKGVIDHKELEDALEIKKQSPGQKTGEILVKENKAKAKDIVSALREQKRFGKRHVELQVKVDTKKLDELVNMAGELAIVQSMIRQNISELSIPDQKLQHNLGHLKQIVSGLQNTAMSMRMVPIKNTFQKMVRLVRDLGKTSGKEVALVMSGEDTEIDRNVVEELYDPMVHMIRNSVDHGIEPPDEREAAGKDRKGTVHLRAYHKGGNVVVEVQDDGRGLDRERILEKARENGLVTDEDKLTDPEIFNLIFEPGFSTAKEVTEISGRGVGMDVVKKAIEELRGRVEINSKPGQGSTFVISLPLTLAIIDGMVVMTGGERFIIPTLSVMKSFRPEKDQYSTVEGKGEVIMFQGRLLPLVRLGHIFGIESERIDPWDGLVLTVQHEKNEMCLLLDELLGKEEVVIKSLGETFRGIKGIAGGTILGDGRVGLILDVAGLFDVARESSVFLH